MNVSSQFSIALPASDAYALLVDLDRVAPCLPGATLGPAGGDGSREVEMAVKLGPMTFRYRGDVRIVERDDAAQRAVLRGTAREIKGQGSASSDIAMVVRDDEAGGSHVEVEAQVDLSGRAAQMGGGMVEAVADRLIADMVECLRARFVVDPTATASAQDADPSVGAGDAAERRPLRAGELLLRLVRDKLARLFGRRRSRIS